LTTGLTALTMGVNLLRLHGMDLAEAKARVLR
jgi:hypothetical protein